jgi:hypothetical protein
MPDTLKRIGHFFQAQKNALSQVRFVFLKRVKSDSLESRVHFIGL